MRDLPHAVIANKIADPTFLDGPSLLDLLERVDLALGQVGYLAAHLIDGDHASLIEERSR